MAIYTYRLGFVQSSDIQAHVLYVVPNTQHVILRDAVLMNASTGPVQLSLYVLTAAGAFNIFSQDQVPPRTTVHWDGRQELRVGDQLLASSSGAPWNAVATGYVFNL